MKLVMAIQHHNVIRHMEYRETYKCFCFWYINENCIQNQSDESCATELSIFSGHIPIATV